MGRDKWLNVERKKWQDMGREMGLKMGRKIAQSWAEKAVDKLNAKLQGEDYKATNSIKLRDEKDICILW